jgi:RsiW-degrading membrane proteinase PrsW (M82 family)
VTAPRLAFDPETPDWSGQTGFVQRHRAAFWLFLVALVITGLDFLGQQLELASQAQSAWLLTIVLLLPYAIPAVAIIYYLDSYEREPPSILLAALLWGAVVATTLALYTNTPLIELIYKLTGDPSFTSDWGAAVSAPFVEELFKGLGVVLLVSIARAELDDVLDGFVWGAMVGIGFLLVEDVFYFVRAFGETGSLVTVVQMFLIRILGAGPYSHFLYSGLVGMGIASWYVRGDLARGPRALVAAGYIVAGWACHFFWNSPILGSLLGEAGFWNWVAFVTVKGLPMLIGLALVVHLARRRERRWFGGLAAAFADEGAITPAERDELSGLRSRRRVRKRALGAKGRDGERLMGRIQRAQLDLARAYSRTRSESDPDVVEAERQVRGLKLEYDGLPRASGFGPGWEVPPGMPMSFVPTHRAPAGGLAGWSSPDPAAPAATTVPPGVPLAVSERAGDWARVVDPAGNTAWVDARRLLPLA